MADQNKLESLYREAQSALKTKEYDRAAELFTQILVIDEDYKDTSRLLAQSVRLKRRKWYNDPRLWLGIGATALISIGVLFLPHLGVLYASQALTATVDSTITPMPGVTATTAITPSPTSVPLVWKRISVGQEIIRDTVTDIAVDPQDPDVIYVGMKSAGIFKSIDGGDSWAPIQQGLGNAQVMSLVIHPQDSNTLLAGTQGGVYVTNNGGKSWTIASEEIGKFLLIDPMNGSHLYLGDGTRVFESNDMGTSWAETHHGGTCPSGDGSYLTLITDPNNSNTLFATRNGGSGGCRGVYRSIDNGRTWDRLGLTRAGAMVIVQDKNGKDVYLTYGDDDRGGGNSDGLFISTSQGEDWSKQQNYNCLILTTNLQNPSSAYCGVEEGGLFVISTQGGVRQSVITSEHVTAIYVDNYNGQERIIAGVEKNGLFISTDGGRSWSQKIGGLGSSYQALKIGATDTARMYVSSLYGEFGCVLYRSDDGGKGWKLIMDDISKIFSKRISSCYPAIDSKNVLYAFQKSALAKSENGGDSWEFILHPSIEYFSPVGESRWVYTNPYVPGPVYFVTEHKPHVYYSFDSGRSWQASTSSSRDYWDSPRLFFAHKSGVIYNADNNGGLEMSADAGKSWRACNGDDPNGGDPANKNSDSFLAIDPRDNNRLILATAGRGIEISTDGCLSWHQSNNGLDSWFVNTVAMDTNNPDILYAGTDGGAYVSTDDGKTWGQVNDGLLGATVVYSIVVDKDSNVYAATPYGIFKLEKK